MRSQDVIRLLLPYGFELSRIGENVVGFYMKKVFRMNTSDKCLWWGKMGGVRAKEELKLELMIR